MKRQLTLVLLLVGIYSCAQKHPSSTHAVDRLTGFDKREELNETSMVNGVPFRSIGPTVMSGRVVDLAVDPDDATHFYVAYASGGLWETSNNGTSFNPIFDHEAVMTIGDIAVDWANNVIWLGSGENNSSRSSYSGVGMYKSNDNGETWQHIGLPESHHVGRIVLHPTDPNTVWVAALGHLYSSNEERGVYKTTDGGQTWSQVLYVDATSGAIDMVIDPNDANTLYAATWHRERRAWNFVESGEGSGIYKSTDAGETWSLLTTNTSGFPVGEGVGRIGLSISSDGTLYASLDNQFRRPDDEEDEPEGLTKEQFRHMSNDDFLALDTDELNGFLSDNGFPEKYDADKVMRMVKKGEIKPVALCEYLEDANTLLFDTPVIGQELYRSNDGGLSWQKTHEGYLDDVSYSYGYYFGQVRVHPTRSNEVYIVGVPILRSEDGGATFVSINENNVHVDHHALWVDPVRDGHLINGNDGGVNITYDHGETWVKCNNLAVGQFYTVAVDMSQPYNVYGGLQDNGVWVGSSTYEYDYGWYQEGQYPYEMLMGGDGMQVAIDTRDNNTIYTGYQFGNYFRINKKTGDQTYISPKHELGERPLRFNWQTPIQLSTHNQDILYLGSNKLHRSMDQGDTWEVISDDLTQGGRQGDVAYGTLTSIHESPLKFGLIYTGSDDGRVHVTKDGGNNWAEITGKLPADMWVSRIQASAHEQGRVYVSLNGYRWDDFNAYLYRSDDYGTTWTPIGADLPAECINVVKEDPENENILYVGTDHGLYISFNQGRTFMVWSNGLPAVAVHDLVVHPRDHDLIVATHGRSIYVADVEHIQQLDFEGNGSEEEFFTFALDPVNHGSYWGSTWSKWLEAYEPEMQIPFFVPHSSTMVINVATADGLVINTFTYQAVRGINYAPYDLSVSEDLIEEFKTSLGKGEEALQVKEADNGVTYLVPGEYTVTVNTEFYGERVGLMQNFTINER